MISRFWNNLSITVSTGQLEITLSIVSFLTHDDRMAFKVIAFDTQPCSDWNSVYMSHSSLARCDCFRQMKMFPVNGVIIMKGDFQGTLWNPAVSVSVLNPLRVHRLRTKPTFPIAFINATQMCTAIHQSYYSALLEHSRLLFMESWQVWSQYYSTEAYNILRLNWNELKIKLINKKWHHCQITKTSKCNHFSSSLQKSRKPVLILHYNWLPSLAKI